MPRRHWSSYATFRRLRDGGDIPAGLRFQVCLPTPMASGYMYVSPTSLAAYLPAYERALLAALHEIAAAIPHRDLSIQWDVCQEVLLFEDYFPHRPPAYKQDVFAMLARLGDAVPEDVECGYHLCYGSPRDEHLVMPGDTAILVELSQGILARLHRRMDFLHLPVPQDRSDAAYFAPLAGLALPAGTMLYLGLIHHDDAAGDSADRGGAHGGAALRHRDRVRLGAHRSGARAWFAGRASARHERRHARVKGEGADVMQAVRMRRSFLAVLLVLSFVPGVLADPPRTGTAAYGDWHDDAPGVVRHIAPDAMPPPFASRSAARGPSVVERPAGATLHVPPGFVVDEFASGLDRPRTLRVAPNGDVFLAESGAGRIRVFRAPDGATRPASTGVFADGVSQPFGIAFWPPGPGPALSLYRRDRTRGALPLPVRRPACARASAGGGTVAGHGGHWTRDVAFSPDGQRMFVSVGSDFNAGTGMAPKDQAEARAWDAAHGLGAAWGDEQDRADVLAFEPEGQGGHVFAAGLRNCVAEAIAPAGGALWCAVNERDGLGDNLPPDYVTSVREGAFYGWPWYYIGDHPDPRCMARGPT